MYLDWTYIVLVLPAVIFSLWASAKVNRTFQKYQTSYSAKGITGYDAARMVLDANGLTNVHIEKTSGKLTDHFDPKANVIRLSEQVYRNTSTAAIGVAAHEAGHAIQYAQGYLPIKVRAAIVPITNLGSKMAMPLIGIGLLFSLFSPYLVGIAYLGVVCFSLSMIFQLVTLPTEFNASRRAVVAIEQSALLTKEELRESRKVLSAAAMTYVAALAVSLMQLLRLLLIVGRRSDDRR